MARTVGIGLQNFEEIITNNYFYIDKTSFIRDWWEKGDSVTLIARPRRFGKTLNMSMLEQFFSVKYAGRGDLFEGLSIWEDKKYRELQGTYPVIALSFANVKATSFYSAKKSICYLIRALYDQYDFLPESGKLNKHETKFFHRVSADMEDYMATMSLNALSGYLMKYYGKKPLILLDEYDTPMQEAYAGGFWDEIVSFMRSLFNSTFKTNPSLGRAVMTGITQVSWESIFSDLNNLKVVTTTSDEYATSFGFTEEEVFAALDEQGLSGEKEQVKRWYDGFIFGEHKDIYNPWSILNFLDKRKFSTYWANTSSNSLVGMLLREGNRHVKEQFETLLRRESIWVPIDEQAPFGHTCMCEKTHRNNEIVYNSLGQDSAAIWSLLLASGYLKVLRCEQPELPEYGKKAKYELALTNYEVSLMFGDMVLNWFGESTGDYNDFVRALLLGDLEAMNDYMNRVALNTFSYFDTGKRASGAEPERFYHGFVLGLVVELQDRYRITSNRESGFGRYDVVIEPKNPSEDAIILEFKVRNARREKTLEDTVAAALRQIEEKQYRAGLIARGIPTGQIRSYGFAFEGMQTLIGDGADSGE